MNKMPELSDDRIARIFYGDEYKDGIRVPEYLNKYFKAITYGQRELLEGWVKLPDVDRLGDILTGCFLAWQRDEEGKTLPEYIANRLYKELTEAE